MPGDLIAIPLACAPVAAAADAAALAVTWRPPSSSAAWTPRSTAGRMTATQRGA